MFASYFVDRQFLSELFGLAKRVPGCCVFLPHPVLTEIGLYKQLNFFSLLLGTHVYHDAQCCVIDCRMYLA